MKTIDLSKEMQALKHKHSPKYHLKPAFTQDAAELWGAIPNKHGVLPAMKETIVHVGQCLGEIRFHKTSKGHWLIGIDVMSSYTGKSYLPNVYDTIGYESRDDARLAGVHKLIDFFEDVVKDMGSTNSDKNRADAQKVLQRLNIQKNPQLGLF